VDGVGESGVVVEFVEVDAEGGGVLVAFGLHLFLDLLGGLSFLVAFEEEEGGNGEGDDYADVETDHSCLGYPLQISV
jgi:hypothetical protein